MPKVDLQLDPDGYTIKGSAMIEMFLEKTLPEGWSLGDHWYQHTSGALIVFGVAPNLWGSEAK